MRSRGLVGAVAALGIFFLSACGGGGGSGVPFVLPEDSGESSQDTYSIFGTINIGSQSQGDDDLMPFAGSLVPENNSEADAQNLPNPVIVNGYVAANSELTATSGLLLQQDARDIFRIGLLDGQTVSLSTFPANDFIDQADWGTAELYLTPVGNPGGRLGPSGAITVPADGDYYVEVAAVDRPSGSSDTALYSMTVSQDLTPVSAMQWSPSMQDFVPGEVLVKLKENTEDGGVRAMVSEALSRKDRLGNGLERWTLDEIPNPDFMLLNDSQRLLNRQATLDKIHQLKKRADLEWAEPNYIRSLHANETDNPLFGAQWHYDLINVPAAWAQNVFGNSVRVAVIDTGIDPTHPDLVGQLVGGYDFVSNATSGGDGNGIDSDPTDEGNTSHGTHVAGTVAAANNTAGGVGVAHGAKIMPLRVLGVDGQGSDADIAQAIRYAAGLSNSSSTTPSVRADVINLSLGGPAFSNTLQAAVDAASSAGVIVIAAAGNDGSSAPSYPAAFGSVISVSAVGQNNQLAPYSNFGSTIDVAAPGGNMIQDLDNDGNPDGVLSTVTNGGVQTYGFFQGTSMAAPHVAGVAALMESVQKAGADDLTPAEFVSFLESGDITDNIGSSNLYGNGLINAAKAITKAGEPVPAFLSVAPQALSITGLDDSVTLTVRNGGSGSLTVTGITSSETWLSVMPDDVIASGTNAGTGTYNVTADRSGFAVGESDNATLTITYNDPVAKTTKISVLVTQPDPATLANVGPLYVGLIDRAEEEAARAGNADSVPLVAFIEATYADGRYTYSLQNLEPGEYFLFASTNMDQDEFVGDPGEPQGDYPVFGEREIITITDSNLTDLDFSVSPFAPINTLSEDGLKLRLPKRIPAGADERASESTSRRLTP